MLLSFVQFPKSASNVLVIRKLWRIHYHVKGTINEQMLLGLMLVLKKMVDKMIWPENKSNRISPLDNIRGNQTKCGRGIMGRDG